jgi:hypothetical protein
MLNSGKKISALRDKKNNSNSCVVPYNKGKQDTWIPPQKY